MTELETLKRLAVKAAKLKEQISALNAEKRKIEAEISTLATIKASIAGKPAGKRQIIPGLSATVRETHKWEPSLIIPRWGELEATGINPFSIELKEAKTKSAKLAQAAPQIWADLLPALTTEYSNPSFSYDLEKLGAE